MSLIILHKYSVKLSNILLVNIFEFYDNNLKLNIKIIYIIYNKLLTIILL